MILSKFSQRKRRRPERSGEKINQITGLNGQINANIIYHTLDIISNTFASDTDYLFCNYGEHCRNQPES